MSEQESLQQKVNAELDKSVDQLDELTLAKIQAARLTALAKAKEKPWWQKTSLTQGVVATSFSVILVALLIIPLKTDQDNDDLALMAAMNPVLAEAPEMLSDLEFLAWLEQEQLLEESSEFGT